MKSKKIIIFLLLLFLIMFIAVIYIKIMPKAGLFGNVIDAANLSKRLSNAVIRIEELDIEKKSNEFGEFRIIELPKGEYTLSIRKSGYLPEQMKISLTEAKLKTIDIRLKAKRPILDVESWINQAAKRINDLFDKKNLSNERIAIAFYKKSELETCDLPEMVLRFATAFNEGLGKNGNLVVVRDIKQASFLFNELRLHEQFKVDFEPAAVSKIGKKLGASIFIIGALLEKREYIEPLVNGSFIEKSSYIPGLSLNDILLQKEVICE